MTMSDNFYENERRMCAFALLNKISRVDAEFDGSGDSGQIDGVSIDSDLPDFRPTQLITVKRKPGAAFNEETKEWEILPARDEAISFELFIREHVAEALQDTGIDWYNNDGGFGEWSWDPRNGISFEVNVRTVNHERMYHEDGRHPGNPELDHRGNPVEEPSS